MNMKKLRFSDYSFSTYNICPRKYKLQFINKATRNKPLDNKYFSFDKSLHLTLSKLNSQPIENLLLTSDIELKTLINNCWFNDGYENIGEELSFKHTAFSILREYSSHPKDIGVENIIINQKLFGNFSNKIVLAAKVDKVHELADGSIEIIDYKTGNFIDKSLDFYNNFQLPLYLFLTHNKLNVYADHISYYYLRHNLKLTFTVTHEDIKNIDAILYNQISTIKADSTFNCIPSPLCKNFCKCYIECTSNLYGGTNE